MMLRKQTFTGNRKRKLCIELYRELYGELSLEEAVNLCKTDYVMMMTYNIIFTSGQQHLRTPRCDQLLADILIVPTECRPA
jgi:hypothetical protein